MHNGGVLVIQPMVYCPIHEPQTGMTCTSSSGRLQVRIQTPHPMTASRAARRCGQQPMLQNLVVIANKPENMHTLNCRELDMKRWRVYQEKYTSRPQSSCCLLQSVLACPATASLGWVSKPRRCLLCPLKLYLKKNVIVLQSVINSSKYPPAASGCEMAGCALRGAFNFMRACLPG